MQVQALHGYFDRGLFYHNGERVNIPEKQHVIVNILNMPIDADNANADIKFWEMFDRLADADDTEPLKMEDFPRADFGRELITFGDNL